MVATPFVSMLGESLVQPGGKGATVSTSEALAGLDVVGLYFSAHWCPPCRGFTPKLGEQYKALKEAGKSIEIVFISSDKHEEAFKEYHAAMPWLALPYGRRDTKATLSQKYGVSGIPTLVFLDCEGNLITDEGREAVLAKSFIEDFPFRPKPVNDLADTTSGIQGDKPVLICLMEAATKEQQVAAQAVLMEAAEAELAKPEDKRTVARFFTGKGGGPTGILRRGCGLANVEAGEQVDEVTKAPLLMALDLRQKSFWLAPKNGASATVTAENVAMFLAELAAGGGKLQKGEFTQG